jgi:hypothetical protein
MLVTCPECGAKISPFADPCPKCGMPWAGHNAEEWQSEDFRETMLKKAQQKFDKQFEEKEKFEEKRRKQEELVVEKRKEELKRRKGKQIRTVGRIILFFFFLSLIIYLLSRS